ncbi:hypothetical protein COOONC_18586 [Cooperia oncophora]
MRGKGKSRQIQVTAYPKKVIANKRGGARRRSLDKTKDQMKRIKRLTEAELRTTPTRKKRKNLNRLPRRQIIVRQRKSAIKRTKQVSESSHPTVQRRAVRVMKTSRVLLQTRIPTKRLQIRRSLAMKKRKRRNWKTVKVEKSRKRRG